MSDKEDTMQVEPYLFFEGRCAEALEFYRKTIGADVTFMMRFGDSPDRAMVMPGMDDKIMHACLRIGETTIMASDGRGTGQPAFHGFSLSLSVADERQAESLFGALAEGGQVTTPLTETFFARRFGMVTDRFGVGWMVILPKP